MGIIIDPVLLRAVNPGPIDVGLAPVRVFDVETWPNFFCVGVWTVGEGFRVFSTEPGVGEPLDALIALCVEPAFWVGYNNLGYDNWLMALALTGETDPRAFKARSDTIFAGTQREQCPRFADGECLDLFSMLKGIFGKAGPLKWVGLKLGYPNTREAPFDFNATLERREMVQVVEDYNLHDVMVTAWCLAALQDAIKARIWLEERYDIEVLNTADSGLAESILMKSLFHVQTKRALPRHAYPRQTEWTVPVAPIVDVFEFATPEMQAAQAVMRDWTLEYRIEHTDNERKVNRIRKRHEVGFEGITLRLGLGGIHSLDKPCLFEADDEWMFLDYDFSGFYPTIIDSYGLRPNHMPAAFNQVFRELIAQRDQAVKDGNTVAALAYKVANNSIFGKSKSAYSFLCDPAMTATVCIVGQMIVLQAIELVAGIGNEPRSAQTIMANTDGITVKVRRHLADAVRQAMHAVADTYDLTVKETEYVRLIRRDGNNYLALDATGKAKAKGAFGRDVGNPEKFAAERIVVDACRELFLHDVPLMDTITAADDIALFVNGFNCSKGWQLTDSTGTANFGRMGRWVHVTAGGIDLYKKKPSEGKLQRCTGTNGGSATGIRLLPDLPAAVPVDLDRAVYLARAERLVKSVTDPEKERTDLLKLSDLTAEQCALFQHNAAITTPDLAKCAALVLDPFIERYAEKRQGNSYDSMRSVLFWVWAAHPGRLTLGDLRWCGEQISEVVDDSFRGSKHTNLEAMVEHYANEVPPFARPRGAAECIDQAWGQAERSVAEGKIKLAKAKKKLYHNSFPEDSAFLGNKQIMTKYTRTRNLFPIALSLCSTCIKHGRPRDDAFLIGILEEVVAYYD